jgi:hypothetical protein
MESFALGPTLKIDFSSAQQQHLATALRETNSAQLLGNGFEEYIIQYRILAILKPKGLYL